MTVLVYLIFVSSRLRGNNIMYAWTPTPNYVSKTLFPPKLHFHLHLLNLLTGNSWCPSQSSVVWSSLCWYETNGWGNWILPESSSWTEWAPRILWRGYSVSRVWPKSQAAIFSSGKQSSLHFQCPHYSLVISIVLESFSSIHNKSH